jgi:hypothetical protein
VRLIDFGLAKPLEEKQGVTRLAGGCGTPGYMAPEQLQGRSVSPKTDLFALGCVLYRMATGTLPFARHKGETDSSFEAFANQLSDPAIQPVPPGERNPQLPSELGDLMLRLLAKDPARRPADADQVMRDLLAIQGKPPGLTETKTFVDTTPEPPSDAPMPAPETPAKRRSIGCSISITITACVALIVASLGIVTLITAPGARAEREKYEVVQKELEILRAERDKLVREEKERLEAEAKNIKTKRELDLKFAAELESFKRRLGEIRGGSGSSENRALKERELEEEQLRWEQAKLKQEKHLQAVLAQLKQNAEEQRRALEANHNRVQTVVVPAPSYYRYHPYYGWGGW